MKTINLEFTEEEANNLMAVVDAGVKALGVQAVLPLVPVLTKINQAVAAKSSGTTHMGSPDAAPDAFQRFYRKAQA
jgi:hypothetical protein